jgi:cell wall-associated NlpC family hydrolase
VRNHFRQNLGVYLNDYDRAEDFASNDSSKLLIINNIETEKCEIVANFADLSKIKNGDVLLFKTPSRSRILPVHFGIFLGNSQFLHHPEDQLSRIDLLDNSWLSRVMYIIRAKNR